MVEEITSYVSPAEAAERLHLSPRRIYALVKAGRVHAVRVGGRLLVESASLEVFASSDARVGRPFSPRRAWAIILLASGENPRGLDPVTRSKLRRILRERSVWSIRTRLTSRAERLDLRAHPSDVRRIEHEHGLVRTGPRFAAQAGLPLVAAEAAPQYYLDASTAESLISRYRLSPSRDPNLVLRCVTDEVRSWLSGAVAPPVAVALDLTEDRDARSRDAARAVLAR